MALITRISRLFAADMNAVIDRMEEPDIVLNQAIRDMQAAVGTLEQRVRKLQMQAEHLASARTAAVERCNAQAEELDVCMTANDDDLARSVIQRRLQTQRQLTDLDTRLAATQASLASRQDALSRQRSELDEMRQKAELFETAGDNVTTAVPPITQTVTPQDIEVALLKEKQRRAQS